MNDRGQLEVLFLCTGNSARSILGEYLLRSMDPRVATYSAGAAPTGKVHPMAQHVLLQDYGIDASQAASKSWETLAEVDLDLVITVCDHARDTCPLWPGKPTVVVHWGSPDPAAVTGSEQEVEEAFRRVAQQIHGRLERFCALPYDSMLREQWIHQLQAIGGEPAASPEAD
ncbi:MAG: arsenate reductase ArsC [Acidobacteriota bacterium]